MMKTRKFIIATVWVAIAALVWSCDDNTGVDPTPSQQNVLAENILIGSNSATNRLRGQGLGGPVGAIYGNFYSSTGGRGQGSPLSLMRNMAGGRSETDSTENENPACLTETWEDDGNGNYTFTLDFGDGCEFYGEFMKGKLVEKGTYTDNSFSSSITYTGFGGEDWSIDGTYSYSGTWNETTASGTSEPADNDSTWLFEATYQFEADLKEQWTEYGYPDSVEVSTGETIITVDYVASGTESMDNDGYTVESRTESVDVSTGESFSAQVDTPLYYDNGCEENDVWIFVSGVESGSYTYNDISGTYSINYGNGECDNIITLTENGETQEIDLGDEWDDWEEECDDHDDD